MKKLTGPVIVLALLLFAARSGVAQSSAQVEALQRENEALRGVLTLQKEIEALREGQRSMQKDLEEIKTLLQGRPAAAQPTVPQNLTLNIAGEPLQGEQTARLTLIEFTDYQCPFCARHVRDTWPQIEKEYVSTGKVKLVLRDFPLESIHKYAFKAAEAAHCARDQDKYWEMHKHLFAHQNALSPTNLPGYAQALGLDVPAFQQCVESGRHAEAIRQDIADAKQAGFTGTPSFALGVAEGDNSNKIKVVRIVKGAQAIQAFKAAIDSLLEEKKM